MEVVDGVENNEVVENNEATDTSKSEKVKTQVSEKNILMRMLMQYH